MENKLRDLLSNEIDFLKEPDDLRTMPWKELYSKFKYFNKKRTQISFKYFALAIWYLFIISSFFWYTNGWWLFLKIPVLLLTIIINLSFSNLDQVESDEMQKNSYQEQEEMYLAEMKRRNREGLPRW